jgi:radical SAM protein with 4Fe4S-binding SPASM domain
VILSLPAPVLYALELTPVCNNRCPGCYNVFAGRRTAAPVLPLDQWRLLLERIRPYAHLVKLTGGEPTLYRDLAGLVSLLDEFSLSYSVFTNARWSDPEALIRLLAASSSFRGMLVSVHGATAASHEAFTGVGGSFDQALDNIRRATDSGLQVVLSTVIHRYNLEELPAVAALCARLGADHVSFNRYLGPPAPQIEPSPAELRGAVARIEALREAGTRVKFGDCVPHCFVPSSARGCLAGIAYCTIDPWGTVRPCSHSPTRLGSLFERSIVDIWADDEARAWRNRVPDACHTCAAFGDCHGGCRAQAETRGLPADPLMTGPLAHRIEEHQAVLYRRARPRSACDIRPQPFGYLMLRGNAVVPLSRADRPLLDACDGETPLWSLAEQYGQRGLQLIHEWSRHGLVDM